MGKAENNFENKWLEEREDGFFYTMKRLSLKDTQEINAGATILQNVIIVVKYLKQRTGHF